MLRVINIIFFPLTLLIGLLLIASGLSVYVHPSFLPWLPFLGLIFPLLFIANLIFMIYWWVQLKLKLIFPLCVAIFSLPHASKYIQYTAKNTPGKGDISVGSYNAQLFGGTRDSAQFQAFIERLEKDSFDILCLQEVFAIDDLKGRVQRIKKAGNFITYNFVRLKPDRPYGMVIFSKYSLLANGRINLGDQSGNMATWADIHVEGDTIRMYNVHLQSIRFQNKDYQFIETEHDLSRNTLEGSKNLMSRMKVAYGYRAAQADSVYNHIEKSQHPVFIAGDLNDVPVSYTYNQLSKGMLDAFRERGSGFERTYKGPFPNFRIDYLLCSKQYACSSYKSYADVPGDHKLLRATFHKAEVVQ